MRPRPLRLLAASATAIFLLTACGDDDTTPLGGGGDQPADDATQDGNDGGDGGNGGDGGDEMALAGSPERGLELFGENGCASCHGGGLAPDLEGVYGSTIELADGSTVVADEEYLARSITDPSADIVPGYDVAMQEFPHLTDDDVADLVAYIITLADADPPGDEGGG